MQELQYYCGKGLWVSELSGEKKVVVLMSLSERVGIHERISEAYQNVFSSGEIRSLLYFQGAIENIVLGKNEEHLRKFYSIDNAYEAVNMLLFDDIGCEQARLWEEKLMKEFWIICRNFWKYIVICIQQSASIHIWYKKKAHILTGTTDTIPVFI